MNPKCDPTDVLYKGREILTKTSGKTAGSEIISLARGLDILRAFKSSDAPLGNKEIAARTGLSKATVARLSHTLLLMGYIRQIGPQGKYHLDDNVTTLGYSFLKDLSIRRIVEPMMQEFANKYEMSVAFGVGDGANMVYLCYCAGANTVTMRLRVGTIVPMHLTAMGIAYLSALPADQLQTHLNAIRLTLAKEDVNETEASLQAAMALTQKNGFSISFGTWRRDIFAVGAPVWLDGGKMIASLNCGARSHGHDREIFSNVLGPELVALASNLSNHMNQLGVNFWNE